MTERERWTVYPLLFLSLGIGLRSHVTSSLELNELACHTLKSRKVEIVGADDSLQLVLEENPPAAGGGGAITIFSRSGKPEVVLRALPPGGLVEVGSAKGVLQVKLGVERLGGIVEAFDPSGKIFRALAVAVDPNARVQLGPPPPADEPQAEPTPETTAEPSGEPAEPSSEPAEPDSETSPTSDEPAGEKHQDSADEPAKEPAGG